MKSKNLLIATGIVLFIALYTLGMGLLFLKPDQRQKIWAGLKNIGAGSSRPAVSKYVLAVTTPAMSILGTVERIDATSIAVQILPWGPLPAPNSDSTSGNPRPVTLGIQLSRKTIVRKTLPRIPYIYKQTNQQLPNSMDATVNVSDIRPGDIVTVSTTSDLRLDTPTFASTVMIEPQPTAFSGTITNISENDLIVNGRVFVPMPRRPTAPGQAQAKEKNVTVHISNATEISAVIPTSPPSPLSKPTTKLMHVSDLKIGQTVAVYSDGDLSNVSDFDALLINPWVPPQP